MNRSNSLNWKLSSAQSHCTCKLGIFSGNNSDQKKKMVLNQVPNHGCSQLKQYLNHMYYVNLTVSYYNSLINSKMLSWPQWICLKECLFMHASSASSIRCVPSRFHCGYNCWSVTVLDIKRSARDLNLKPCYDWQKSWAIISIYSTCVHVRQWICSAYIQVVGMACCKCISNCGWSCCGLPLDWVNTGKTCVNFSQLQTIS